MSNFRLIHTGDWHIGRVYAMFPGHVAQSLAHARITVVDRIAQAARDFGASHVLVSGDTYDAPDLPDRDVNAPLKRLAGNGDITWHVIPGNHDPVDDNGIWNRVCAAGLPPNVRLYRERAVVEIAPQVWLFPTPVRASDASVGDPTDWMNGAVTPEGALRIGLAHGAASDFGTGDSGPVISTDRADDAGLDYLALGDWHGQRTVGERARYAGTPEPEQFKTNASGFVTAVSLSGRILETKSLPTARHRWLTRDIELEPLWELDRLADQLDLLGSDAPEAIVRVRLSLATDPLELSEIAQRRASLEACVRYLVWDESELVVTAEPSSLAETLQSPQLVEIGSRLAEQSGGDERDRSIAAKALKLLLAHAAASARGTRQGG